MELKDLLALSPIAFLLGKDALLAFVGRKRKLEEQLEASAGAKLDKLLDEQTKMSQELAIIQRDITALAHLPGEVSILKQNVAWLQAKVDVRQQIASTSRRK